MRPQPRRAAGARQPRTRTRTAEPKPPQPTSCPMLCPPRPSPLLTMQARHGNKLRAMGVDGSLASVRHAGRTLTLNLNSTPTLTLTRTLTLTLTRCGTRGTRRAAVSRAKPPLPSAMVTCARSNPNPNPNPSPNPNPDPNPNANPNPNPNPNANPNANPNQVTCARSRGCLTIPSTLRSRRAPSRRSRRQRRSAPPPP